MLSNIDFRFYRDLFMRRLPLFLLVWIVVAAAAVGVAYILPPVYVSQAVILVERPRIPDSLASSTVNVTSDEVIQVIQQRLLTSENLSTISERLGMFADQPELSQRQRVDIMMEATTFKALATARTGPGGSAATVAFGISYASDDPELSAKVAGEMADIVLIQNRTFRTEFAEETTRFFSDEVQRLSTEMAAVERDIVAFKNTNAGVLPDSVEFRRQETSRIQGRLIELQNQEAALREQRAQIERAIENPLAATALPGQPQSIEEQELARLRRELAQKQAVFSGTHPEVVALNSEISALEGLVRGRQEPAAVTDRSAEPATQLELNLRQVDTNLGFLQQQRANLESQFAELQDSIAATPDIEMSLNVLMRNYEALQAQYDGALTALNTAVQGQSIEVGEQAESFELIEPATPPVAPESPDRVLIAVAGVIGGLGIACALLILLELMNATVRRPVELVKGMGIQPFATIPYIRTQHEITRARMRMMTVLSFLLVGLPVLTYIVHNNVMPLEEMFDRVIVRFGLADDTGATG